MGYTFVGNIEERKQQRGAYMGVAYILCPHCHELMYTLWRCSEKEKKEATIKIRDISDHWLSAIGNPSDYSDLAEYTYFEKLYICRANAEVHWNHFYAIPAEIRQTMDQCSHCGKKINASFIGNHPAAKCEVVFSKYRDDYEIDSKKLTKVFERFLQAGNEEQKLIASDETRKYLETCEKKHELVDMPKDNAAAMAVAKSPELLSKYIKYLLEAEIKLRCAKEYRQNLKLQQAQSDIEKFSLIAKQKNAINEELKAMERAHEESVQKAKETGEKELAELLAAFNVSPPVKQPNIVLRDEDIQPMPQKADYIKINAPVPPTKPEYIKPGLFNRKRIERENSDLAEKYHQEQVKYEEELHRYSCAVQEYEKATEERKADIERKQQEIDATNKRLEREHKKKLKEYQAQREQYEESCTQRVNDEIEQKVKQLQEKFEEQKKAIKQALKKANGCSETEVGQLLKGEIAAAEKHIDMLIHARNTLLSYNVIFPKYRSNSILYILLEYLDSGRCTALTGKDGAYNIYEAEVRADKMIAQLTKITDVLSVINEKQTLLYAEMHATRQLTENINLSLTKAVQEMQAANANLVNLQEGIDALHATEQESLETMKETRSLTEYLVQETGNVSRKMDKVVKNTAVTAHYSAVTAYYSKQTAEMTDALGFMLALK